MNHDDRSGYLGRAIEAIGAACYAYAPELRTTRPWLLLQLADEPAGLGPLDPITEAMAKALHDEARPHFRSGANVSGDWLMGLATALEIGALVLPVEARAAQRPGPAPAADR